MDEDKMMVEDKKNKKRTKEQEKMKVEAEKKGGNFWNLKEGWVIEKKRKKPTSMFGLV